MTSNARASKPPRSAPKGQATDAAPTRPRAYSYIRWSTPDQGKGDSLHRQTEAARAYAARYGLELDQNLDITDPGVSAHYGKNIEAGKLRAFLEAVRDGIVPQGSYLLVESLDRISRQTVRKAVRTMEEIVEAGITLVDLSDNGKCYNTETLDTDHGFSFMMMALRFMRAHEESAIKSTRLSAAYTRKRQQAAARTENGKPFTRMLPAWLQCAKEARRVEVIPKRAEVVRYIFKMADEGLGQHAIAQRLNTEGVPTFGGHGNQRKADAWHRTYIKKLLTNSAVVGTFTPHQRRSDAQGNRRRVPLDPVENYFPRIIERDLFDRVASRAQTIAPRGRNATAEPKSVFAGLLRCAHCGGTVTRMPKGDDNVYLICSRANRRLGCRYQAVRYEDVEHVLLENAGTIMQEAPRGQEAADIEREITNLDIVVGVIADEARDLTDELIREKSNAVRTRLREKERELEAARERLHSLRAQRDTLTSPYVARKLQALEQALTHKPLNVVEANKALKEAVSHIVLNPESAELTLHWHHAPEQPTEAGTFFSRHYTMFDEVPGGYVAKRDRGATS
jgi:DNA invertase Pin-like site-specific DNA recombinase